MSKVLSNQEVERRMAVYERGLPDKESAELLGITMEAYCSWRHRTGLKRQYGRRLSKQEHRRRYLVWEAELTDAQSARLLGISSATYRDWRIKNNLKSHGEMYPKRSSGCKMNDRQRALILPFIRDLTRHANIAKNCGVKPDIEAYIKAWVNEYRGEVVRA